MAHIRKPPPGQWCLGRQLNDPLFVTDANKPIHLYGRRRVTASCSFSSSSFSDDGWACACVPISDDYLASWSVRHLGRAGAWVQAGRCGLASTPPVRDQCDLGRDPKALVTNPLFVLLTQGNLAVLGGYGPVCCWAQSCRGFFLDSSKTSWRPTPWTHSRRRQHRDLMLRRFWCWTVLRARMACSADHDIERI